jgi:hypothetical protein
MYQFLQYFASVVFPVGFFYFTVLYYAVLLISLFRFVLFAWVLAGNEMNKMKDAKNHLYTIDSPVTERYSVRFHLRGYMLVLTRLIM